MSIRTITAVYDTQAEAERAVEALAARGVPRSDLQVHREPSEPATGDHAEAASKGFWASLADLFVPDDDRYTYAEALRRGSVVVTARVDDAHYDAAAELMDTHGAVDLDERESGWRSEGWTGGAGIGQSRAATDGSAAATASRMNAATAGASENGGLMSPNMDGLAGSARTGSVSGDEGKPGTMLSRGLDEVAGTNISGAHPENEGAGGMGSTSSRTMPEQVGLPGGDQGMAARRGQDDVAGARPELGGASRVGSSGRLRVRSYVYGTPDKA